MMYRNSAAHADERVQAVLDRYLDSVPELRELLSTDAEMYSALHILLRTLPDQEFEMQTQGLSDERRDRILIAAIHSICNVEDAIKRRALRDELIHSMMYKPYGTKS